MAVVDQLEARLAELRQEVADIETAIRVIRSLGEQKPTQKSADIDAPLFTVRRTVAAAPAKKKPSRPAGDAFWAQQERAEQLRLQIEQLFKREGRPLYSGQVIDLVGVRDQGKQAQDRIYNALATMHRTGLITREETGSAWELVAPGVPAGGSEGPSGQSERAA